MRNRLSIAAFALVLTLMSGIALAQPPGCTWEGDPCIRYGFGQYDKLPYNQPGNDFATIYPGATLTYIIAPYNATPYNTVGCTALDTLCFHAVSLQGWTFACNPPMGELQELPAGGYIWYQEISITAPCDANIGDKDTIIASCAYANTAGLCAPECGDCQDPNIRPATGVKYYNADTLIVTIVAPPPGIAVYQDTLSFIGQGQPQAHVQFSVCNENECAPPTDYIYNVTSRGHVGAPINTIDTVSVPGGDCRDVYGVISASTALSCAFDTLTIIVWSAGEPVVYDTCVQVVHVISACAPCIPVFTPAVAAILVLALVLVAAVFIRRRSARTT
ncbi:MAG: hypothetical protein NTW97_04090 [Candidatus Krumholzibacteria bacterium]|nr:hypothetical protein [Candidatus Krumholzibacteria bacterium]